MGFPLIEELLAGDCKEFRDIANNEAILVGFLTLAKRIDDLPDLSTRFYEDARSLYQVTSSGYSIEELEAIMADFFGKPAKATGKSLPAAMRFNPVVKFLGGIRKDQAFFQKKIKTGSFYGALWPWHREAGKVEIHLGFCSPGMRDADYDQLGILIKKFLSKKKLEAVSGVGGQIHGISLPSFLQMSEMEGATYALKVSSGDRVGYLHLDGGSLIAAQVEDQIGSEAAYRIISWDNASIQIEPADADREREIHEPLMHVMMESLKIKDESGDEVPPPPPPRQGTASRSADRQPTRRDRRPEKKADPPSSPEAPDATPGTDSGPVHDAPVSVPFGKPVDKSMGRQKQMSRTGKLLIALGATILLAAFIFTGRAFFNHRQADRRYEQLTANLAAEKALDARIVLLMKYLNAHPEDVHRAELERRLNEANLEIEERDYQKTIEDVKQLPIDAHYEKKALSLYSAFLSKYPQSTYVESVNEAIDGIRQEMATAHYEALKDVSQSDFQARYSALQTYLDRFPKGAEREAVHRMLADLADRYYALLEKKAAACDAKQVWDDCIAQCDHFVSDFSKLPNLGKVEKLRASLQDGKDLADLTVKAELAGDDYISARQIYTEYLKNRPDTTQQAAISERIAALDAAVAEKKDWEDTEAYATNAKIPVSRRIAHVEAYIQKNQAGPYNIRARQLLDQLEPEMKAAVLAQKEDQQKRRNLARQQAARERRDRERRRTQKLREQVSRQLNEVARRYTDNGDGTVTDRVTGLTWCLLDSYLALGRCISYRTAKAYVQQLNAGNHTDWRLPTAGELAAIYKSSPYFPGSGADWYWTAESFARGYHRVVDVVTSVPETVFTRISKNEETCGNVRAVR